MLTQEQAEAIVTILSNKTDSLSIILKRFNSSLSFETKLLYLTTISVLLTDSLLDHFQQIVAIYMLINSFHSNPVQNSPFYPVFEYLFDFRSHSTPNLCPPQMYDILSNVLSGQPTTYLNSLSASDVLSQTFEVPHPSIPPISTNNFQPRISPILSERTDPADSINSKVMDQNEIIIELLTKEDILSDFDPAFIRPAPTISPIFPEELRETIITSPDAPPFIYDDNFSFTSRESIIILLQKAAALKLKPIESEALAAELRKDSNLAKEANLSDPALFSMIFTNSNVAKEVFKILGPTRPSVLDKLTQMDITSVLSEILKEICVNNKISEISSFLEKLVNSNISRFEQLKHAGKDQKMANLVGEFCNLMKALYKIQHIADCLNENSNLILTLDSFCVELLHKGNEDAKELHLLLSK